MSSPDYTNMNTDAVLRDFLLRIEHYQEKYQLLDEIKEKELSYMKIYNTGEKVVVHKHEGHIQSRIVYYLMNIHITPRTIYLTRVSILRHYHHFLLHYFFHSNDKQFFVFASTFLFLCSTVKANTIYRA